MAQLCDFQNCNKHASYGLKRHCPTRCNLHKELMKSVIRMCICGKCEKACYNEPNETIAICCKLCKTATMVDVKSKRCKNVERDLRSMNQVKNLLYVVHHVRLLLW